MKTYFKKGISSLLVLVMMMMSLFVGMPQTAFAATNTVNPANNKVAMSVTSVYAGDTVTINAQGDGVVSGMPADGAECYLPDSWSSTDGSGPLSNGDYYSAEYVPTTPGIQTITVTFKKMTFNISSLNWVDTGATDTKQLTLNVLAGPALADPAKNVVTPDMYKLNTRSVIKINFSGDRQEITRSVDGDERYIPISLTSSSGENATLDETWHSYQFNTTPNGAFTVTITFQKQTWSSGGGWINAAGLGATDTKTISYDVLGGTPGTGNLKVIIGNGNTIIQRYDGSKFEMQYYQDAGCFANVNGELYYIGDYYNVNGYLSKEATFLSQTVSGNSIISTWQAGTLQVTQTATLTNDTDQYVSYKWSLKNTGGSPITDLRFTRGEDTYLSGGDEGSGFWRASSNTVGVTKTLTTGQQRLYLTGITTPDSYTSQDFDLMNREVVAGGALSNTINPASDTDNGYAMQWYNASLAAGGTWDIDASESFIVSPFIATCETKLSTGASVTLNFNVQSFASSVQTVTYSVTAPAGWTAVPARTGETLQPTSTTSLPVTVTPASGAVNGDYDIQLNITSALDDAQGTGTVSLLAVPTYYISTAVASSTGLTSPEGIAFYNGKLYFADGGKVKSKDAGGTIATVAGIGTSKVYVPADEGAVATGAAIDPNAIAFDSTGNMYIAEKSNNLIRMVDITGNISTVFDTADGIQGPEGIAFDSAGNVYVSDSQGVFKGTTSGAINQIGSGRFVKPLGMTADGNGNVYIADAGQHAVYKVDGSGNITVVAGTEGTSGNSGDEALAIAAKLNQPSGVSVDGAGNLFILDNGNSTIRYVDAISGKIVTIAGTGVSGLTGDNGPGLSAQLNGSVSGGIALDSNKNVYISDDANKVIRKLSLTVATTPTTPTTGSSGGGGGSSTPTSGVDVLVNGKAENAGTATKGTIGNQTLTTVTVDEKKLEQKMQSEGNNAIITIPINTKTDVVVGELNGQIVKDMETKQDTLELRTADASYFLPAQQIDMDAVSAQVGQNVALKDIKIQVTVAKSASDTVKVVEDSAQKGNFTIQIQPMDFNVKAIYGGKTVDVNRFDIYVQRLVAIPDGVDTAKITTAVITESDGTSRHVPTAVVKIDGKYYAKINSLTNSTYSVVWHPMEFKDVANHWAKSVVNDMGSRMVISGVGNGLYEPNSDITRAEFAAIIVRALGLKPGDGSNSFTDVASNQWYCDYIKTATTYKIIAGYGDGKFGPNDKITREQAMTMISRAMEITGLKTSLSTEDMDKLLAGFKDGKDAASYAKTGIAACVKAGVVSGRGDGVVAPKAYITRAEVAAIVSRLLQKSGLI